jgi:glycosyltransferase involved in cell wall biosynthesis
MRDPLAPAGSASVSVAICTHNGERFIEEQLRSIIGQTRLPAEIVISDDASTDRTVELVRGLMAANEIIDPSASIKFTLIINSTPLGVAANFEQAIRACSGNFITLCDQDDVWLPRRVEAALEIFDQDPSLLLVHSNAQLVDESGAGLGASLFDVLGVDEAVQKVIHGGGAFELLLRRNLVTGAATMIRRELADLAVPFPLGWLHDEWLAIVAAAVSKIDVIAEPLIDYRQHGRNQIGVRSLSVREKFGRMIEPGHERNSRLLQRSKSLALRLPDLRAVSPERLYAARQKELHEERRSVLPPIRALRILPVCREFITGRYGRFGRGSADAVRDLIQPLNSLG